MCVFWQGKSWWYEFTVRGKRYRRSGIQSALVGAALIRTALLRERCRRNSPIARSTLGF
jgi:hypothetical protein